ncbi:unnamed protein product [Coregonus sp. 'balchen']|nr:unnamed protein product [Coregonus sp. 'balchen']
MGQMQCKVFDSMLALPQDQQAVRAMTIIAITFWVLGVSIVGAKCTNCIKNKKSKAKVMIISRMFFILAVILHHLGECGASLYIGWEAGALLLVVGVILCSSCPPSEIEVMYLGAVGWTVSLVHCVVYRVVSYGPPSGVMWALMTITFISTILGSLGVMGSLFGTKCCNCIKSNRTRVKARVILGTFFILSGILQLSTVFLVAHYMIQNIPFLLDHLGVLGYLAQFNRWSASMLLIGGTIRCCCIFKRNQPDSTTTQSTSR